VETHTKKIKHRRRGGKKNSLKEGKENGIGEKCLTLGKEGVNIWRKDLIKGGEEIKRLSEETILWMARNEARGTAGANSRLLSTTGKMLQKEGVATVAKKTS